MTTSIMTTPTHILFNPQVIRFSKGSKPVLVPNEWQVWNGELDEGDIPDREHGAHQVLVPLHWWITHHQDGDIIKRANQGEIGVWFASDEDVLKHADIIEAGKKVWPLVAAHFPVFRDGRSFSTAALLRDRLDWQGEIRAIGDVLIDQLLQGARVGFDSFELRPDQNLDIGLSQFSLFTVTTQNSWRDKRSLLSVVSA